MEFTATLEPGFINKPTIASIFVTIQRPAKVKGQKEDKR